MPDQSKIIRIRPDNPDPDVIKTAGKIISRNGVVIFPTRCLYGVAANALDEAAVKKVFDLKKRPFNNPILVLTPNREMVSDLAVSIPTSAKQIMDAFWPGHITIVMDAKDSVSPLITAGTGKIGIRMPGHPIARALVNHLSFPITGTSANLSGHPGCFDPAALDPYVIESSDLVLDGGVLKGGTGSTIIDTTTSPVTLLRQGEIISQEIRKRLPDAQIKKGAWHQSYHA